MQDLMEVSATLFVTICFLLDFLTAYHVGCAYSNDYTPNDEGDILRQKAFVVSLKITHICKILSNLASFFPSDVRLNMETMRIFISTNILG